jgi:hypothetical protein
LKIERRSGASGRGNVNSDIFGGLMHVFIRRAIAFCFVGTISLALAHAAPVQPPPAGGMWDLNDLYPSAAAWESEHAAVQTDVAKLAQFKGTLGRDAASLRKACDAISLINKRIARLAVYASLKADEDVRVAPNQARNTAADNLNAQFVEATSWVKPEIQAIGASKIEAFIASEPGLKPHAFGLRDILRSAPHALGEETERVMAQVANEDVRDSVRALANTEAFQQSRRERKKVEMRFAHMKRILKLDRLRPRGLNGVRDEVLLTATAQNLRRLAKLLYRAPPTLAMAS